MGCWMQVNCHFLQPRDKVTLGMAEWTLEEAAADLRIAHEKLKTLPRHMRSGRRRKRRLPPLVTFTTAPSCSIPDERPCCPATDTYCGPCRESCISTSYAKHAGLSSTMPFISSRSFLRALGPSYVLSAPQPFPVAVAAPPVQLPQTVTSQHARATPGTVHTQFVQAPQVLPSPLQLQMTPVGPQIWGS